MARLPDPRTGTDARALGDEPMRGESAAGPGSTKRWSEAGLSRASWSSKRRGPLVERSLSRLDEYGGQLGTAAGCRWLHVRNHFLRSSLVSDAFATIRTSSNPPVVLKPDGEGATETPGGSTGFTRPAVIRLETN